LLDRRTEILRNRRYPKKSDHQDRAQGTTVIAAHPPTIPLSHANALPALFVDSYIQPAGTHRAAVMFGHFLLAAVGPLINAASPSHDT